MIRSLIRLAAFIAIPSLPLLSQEPWDPSFHLVGGTLSGSNSTLGQKTNYGLSMAGAYTITPRSLIVFEAGYRAFPNATEITATGSLSRKSDGYYAGAWLRYRAPGNVLRGGYTQVGLRAWQFMATDMVVVTGGNPDGTDLRVETKGPRNTSWKPAAGIGYRFDERISLELVVSGFGAKDASGAVRAGTVLEVSLGIHL
jgi:hypothetical protein